MPDIRNLLKRLEREEEGLWSRRFLAPCVRGGYVRTNLAGLVYTFAPRPAEFQGWGIFQPAGEREAELIEEACLAQVAEYLKLFPAMRVRLCHRLSDTTWLAYPANVSDMRQRFPQQGARPLPVHLVTEDAEFEQVLARSLGGVWWFEELDRRAAPAESQSLRQALRSGIAPAELRLKGLTPEMRACYTLSFRREELERERKLRRTESGRRVLDEARLRKALRFGGGDLRSFQDRAEFWLVEWEGRDGQLHTSAIEKNGLTVISAGICLSGEDQKFDLQSLVGVVEGDW